MIEIRQSLRIHAGVLVALVAALFLVGCSPSDTGDAALDLDRPLKLAYLPGEEDPEGRMRAHAELATFLSERIGREIELIQAVSYAPTIEALRAGKIDIMRSGGSFTYLIAHEKAGAEAIVRVGNSEGPGLYRSSLVAWPGSGIESLDDLHARASEIDFAFVDPASTSGHLIPRAHLESMGLNPDEDFARTIFTMSHTNSAMTITSGKVHAGAISHNSYTRLIERGVIEPDDMTVLWESDPIPTGPVVVRKDMPEDLKLALQDAYLALDDEDSALYRALQEVYSTEDLRFYPAEDADWNGLREIARGVASFDMLPTSR